jgi:hypothetical protein
MVAAEERQGARKVAPIRLSAIPTPGSVSAAEPTSRWPVARVSHSYPGKPATMYREMGVRFGLEQAEAEMGA